MSPATESLQQRIEWAVRTAARENGTSEAAELERLARLLEGRMVERTPVNQGDE